MAVEETGLARAISEDPILQIGSGFRAAKLLFVANEVGLFEQLATGPTSLNGLAERTGLAPPRLRVIMNAMVAVGMIEANDGEYRNSPVAATFLTTWRSRGVRTASSCGSTPTGLYDWWARAIAASRLSWVPVENASAACAPRSRTTPIIQLSRIWRRAGTRD